MNRITFFITFTILILSNFMYGQKKPLTHDVYDEWKDMERPSISESGNFVWYSISEQKGNSEIHFHNFKSKSELVFKRAINAALSHNEKYFVFQVMPDYHEVRKMKLEKVDKEDLPKKDLVIFHINSGKYDTIENVKSFVLPKEESSYLAFSTYKHDVMKMVPDTAAADTIEDPLKEEVETIDEQLVFKKFADTSRLAFFKVESFEVAEAFPKAIVQLKKKDSTQFNGIVEVDVNELSWQYIDTTHEDYKKPTISHKGNYMAWVWSNDTVEDDEKSYFLSISKKGKIEEFTSVENRPNWTFSPYQTIDFSKDEKELFINLRLPKVHFPEDTTELEDEKVSLDIWSWNDNELMTMQLNNLSSDKKRGYLAHLDLRKESLVGLEDTLLTSISYSTKFPKTITTAISDVDYEWEKTYTYPWRRDLYVINVNSGKKTLIKKASGGYHRISPKGKYTTWYEPEDSSWYAYDISGYEIINLSRGIQNPVYDVDHDVPSYPNSYGSGGWIEKDKGFIIYDEYDVFLVDPKKPMNPRKVTKGREKNTTYRVYRLNSDLEYIEESLAFVSVFNHQLKTTNLGTIDLNTGKIEMITSFTGNVGRYQKAKNSNRFIYTKENYKDYPDLYTSANGQEEKLSTTNPQQDDYRWGSVELVSWKSYSGLELEGLLYKPEDFDSTKKYPMVVYFYETYSDRLHSHYKPQPQWSIINITYFTSNEYVVFVPDIKYRDGHPGKSAYDCIVSGTEKVLSMGFVDETKIGIQGQSWGGYQVAQLVTMTDMYTCAMAGAPVSNMTSAYGGIRWGSGHSREFQYERGQSRIGVNLWEGLDLYLENSPVFSANKVNTPLLIMHNDQDGAVPWYQGIEYYMALRRLNRKVWLLNYNGEQHNLIQRHNRQDLTIRMSQFFDHYLKGEKAPEWMIKGRKAIEKDVNKAY